MNEAAKQALPKIVEAVTRLAKIQVVRDCINGAFRPEQIKSFSDLHDHVDANYYGNAFEESTTDHLEALFDDGTSPGDDYFQMTIEHVFSPVQDKVDAWIKDGGLRAVVRSYEAGDLNFHLLHLAATGLPIEVGVL